MELLERANHLHGKGAIHLKELPRSISETKVRHFDQKPVMSFALELPRIKREHNTRSARVLYAAESTVLPQDMNSDISATVQPVHFYSRPGHYKTSNQKKHKSQLFPDIPNPN